MEVSQNVVWILNPMIAMVKRILELKRSFTQGNRHANAVT